MKPGERVISTTWSKKSGELGKVSKVTALVKWDGEERYERVYREGVRLETAEDVAKRAHEIAMRKWRLECPETTIAHVEYSHRYGMGNEAIGASSRPHSPADMRQAADEFRVLADWFERKPKETP